MQTGEIKIHPGLEYQPARRGQSSKFEEVPYLMVELSVNLWGPTFLLHFMDFIFYFTQNLNFFVFKACLLVIFSLDISFFLIYVLLDSISLHIIFLSMYINKWNILWLLQTSLEIFVVCTFHLIQAIFKKCNHNKYMIFMHHSTTTIEIETSK